MKATKAYKEGIVADYLKGDVTYRELEKRHGVDFRIIHSWVMNSNGKKRPSRAKLKTEDTGQKALSTDVKQLQAELRKAQLHNKLLNAIIDIAEEQLKIDIRKKSGTKR